MNKTIGNNVILHIDDKVTFLLLWTICQHRYSHLYYWKLKSDWIQEPCNLKHCLTLHLQQQELRSKGSSLKSLTIWGNNDETLTRWNISLYNVFTFSLPNVLDDSMFLEVLCDQLEHSGRTFGVIQARKHSPTPSFLCPIKWYIHRLHWIKRRYIFEIVKWSFFVTENKLEYQKRLLCELVLHMILQDVNVCKMNQNNLTQTTQK